jgi:hypothetical protein
MWALWNLPGIGLLGVATSSLVQATGRPYIVAIEYDFCDSFVLLMADLNGI